MSVKKQIFSLREFLLQEMHDHNLEAASHIAKQHLGSLVVDDDIIPTMYSHTEEGGIWAEYAHSQGIDTSPAHILVVQTSANPVKFSGRIRSLNSALTHLGMRVYITVAKGNDPDNGWLTFIGENSL